jgi:hypothetical protein
MFSVYIIFSHIVCLKWSINAVDRLLILSAWYITRQPSNYDANTQTHTHTHTHTHIYIYIFIYLFIYLLELSKNCWSPIFYEMGQPWLKGQMTTEWRRFHIQQRLNFLLFATPRQDPGFTRLLILIWKGHSFPRGPSLELPMLQTRRASVLCSQSRSHFRADSQSVSQHVLVSSPLFGS